MRNCQKVSTPTVTIPPTSKVITVVIKVMEARVVGLVVVRILIRGVTMEVNRLVLAVLGASKTRDHDLEVKARDKVGKVSQALSALLVSYIPLSSGMNAAVYVRF